MKIIMKKLIPILMILVLPLILSGQRPMTYQDSRNKTHLVGPITIEDLSQDTTYAKWYHENYDAITLSDRPTVWASDLKDVKVKVFLGTWCGDSKREVPRFIRLWNDLGLDEDQLDIIALYNGDKTKQGPNGEEIGMGIHRVPTFIFERDGAEIARIVEEPVTDLQTDIAQIALGHPTAPCYGAANYLMQKFDEIGIDAIRKDARIHLNTAYGKVSKSSELNTLGYVLLSSGRIDEAILVFEFNTRFFKHNPNVYDSLGEGLAARGDIDAAIENYKKVLELAPKDKHAKKHIKVLKKRKREVI